MVNHLQERRQDEKGFTLIELMVVVLIMGILMAIAIPTFLSTKGSANDASAKSNATNAFVNEKSIYASTGVFTAINTTAGGASVDDTLPWGDATSVKGTVATYAQSGVGFAAVEVEAYSTSGNCFIIIDYETPTSAVIGYYSQSVACPGAIAFTAAAAPVAVTSGSFGTPTATALTLAIAQTAGKVYSSW